MNLSKEEYKKYKKVYLKSRYNILDKKEYNIIEDYNYSPDKSLSIIVKQKCKNAFIWNDSFIEWVCILNSENNEELERKFNRDFFEFFRFTFRNEWNEFEV